ncbi:MAG TPA: translation initiation factor IF-2 subunit alpha [Candidatus Nanoarchaeia archaeon]|nr:translation initiation factor IF-2 subunit alpha [Candidatus Nanoarchaeia archaeon]
MLYKKQGNPEAGDIVLCTVKKILFHSVFVSLDDYENKEGMIHISEISPGRIRNIRDFVKEGKKIVCKILKVHEDKNHIDLSLRRVNNSERIEKSNEIKQELKAEKLLETVAKKLNKSVQELYKEVGEKIVQEYGSLNIGFQSIALENTEIKDLKLPKKTEDIFIEIINDKIKPPEVKISSTITIQSNDGNGIEIIKEILLKIKKDNTEITYIGAPRYKLILTSTDYKTAEKEMLEIKEKFLSLTKQKNCLSTFNRDEKK